MVEGNERQAHFLVATAGEKVLKKNQVYSIEFQAMLDSLDQEDQSGEEAGMIAEKKRRLNANQVKALEKNFEIENKLEPERKARLAEELGLQPRQVAIWFQNRRARWKTKQLEKDYSLLKANYDTLKLDFDSLEQEKESLVAEVLKEHLFSQLSICLRLRSGIFRTQFQFFLHSSDRRRCILTFRKISALRKYDIDACQWPMDPKLGAKTSRVLSNWHLQNSILDRSFFGLRLLSRVNQICERIKSRA